MEIQKCYCCGGTSFELSAINPPIRLRPKEPNFLTLNLGTQMAAKVCRTCGAVSFTVDKKEMSNLPKKPKGSQFFMFIFVIIMITLSAYTKYHVNFLEKELVKKHDQLEKKDAEIKILTKNLDALHTTKQ